MILTVTHVLSTPIPIINRINQYPSLDIQLEYDLNGCLEKIIHRLESDSDLDPATVADKSSRQLRLLFQIIEYYYGLPVRIEKRNIKRHSDDRMAEGSTTLVPFFVNGAIVNQVQLPEEAVLRDASPRLPALLGLFNAARPPASDGEAIRLYYLIWEELRGKIINRGHGLPEQRLKYTRDFVSHGVSLDNGQAKNFIESQIRAAIAVYNPMDEVHKAFVARQRVEGRSLIEQVLRQQLNV